MYEFSDNTSRKSNSVNVAFKSNFIRNFVLETSSNFGRLTHSIILGQENNGDLIYSNGLLPHKAYQLLKAVKRRKAQLNWDEHIWVNNTRTWVRKVQDKSEKPFEIFTKADLDKIA